MSLYDRRCTACNLIEIDRLEAFGADELIECPECHSLSFKKQPCCPSFIWIAGENAADFANELDRRREAAANGHGNHSLKD
jgi:predicted nucleic acid-binding Zn ribbon protein